MGEPTLLAEIQERLWSWNRERWFRRMIRWNRHAPSVGFFDSYPRFFSTSVTESAPDRLNQRYRALIQSNAAIIAGRRVLDIASHDGRWSLAAHKAGAKYVLGIEARQHLVESARVGMREYGVPEGQVEFVQGDLMVELEQLEIGRFDTVFCFGLFYHTMDHMLLLRKIGRLKPTNLVMDTAISTRPGSIIHLRREPIERESNAAVGDPGDPAQAVTGNPSRAALEWMLKAAGFSGLHYYDWRNAGIKRWDDLKAYYMGSRVSGTATYDAISRNSAEDHVNAVRRVGPDEREVA